MRFFHPACVCLFVLALATPSHSAVNFLSNSWSVSAGSYERGLDTTFEDSETREIGTQVDDYAFSFENELSEFAFPARDGSLLQTVTIDAQATTILNDQRIGATFYGNVTKSGAGFDNSAIRFGMAFNVSFEVIDEPATILLRNELNQSFLHNFEFTLSDAQTGAAVVSTFSAATETRDGNEGYPPTPFDLAAGSYNLSIRSGISYGDLAGGSTYSFSESYDLGIDLLNPPASSEPPTTTKPEAVPEPTSLVVWLLIGSIACYCGSLRNRT